MTEGTLDSKELDILLSILLKQYLKFKEFKHIKKIIKLTNLSTIMPALIA